MKVAVSVPDPIFEAAERLAKQRQVPRSQLFAEALEEYVSRHGGAAVTAKLNEVYASEGATVDRRLVRAQSAAIGNETW
jgi:metal-responsive CopG/Arc/MetJ family transcriptional regulator